MNVSFLPSALQPDRFSLIKIDGVLSSIKNGIHSAQISALPNSTLYPDRYKQAKLKLPTWAFNGVFSDKVDNSHFIESSGLFHFDIDGLLNGMVQNTKQNLIDNCPNLYAVWLSPSGNGLKGLVRIPDDLIHNDTDFKKAFSQIESYLAGLGVTIDKSCKDVRRLCFVCSDPDIYINTDAPCFAINMDFVPQCPDVSPSVPVSNTAKKYIDRCCNLIFNSTKGNHHDARLRAGKLAGGYVASGLVNEFEVLYALERASRMISSQYGDNEAIVLKELKSISNALENGRLLPCEPDRQQISSISTAIPPKPILPEQEIEGLIWSNGDELAKNATAPKFLINDIINTDAHGILYANSGAYKTFMTLAMAHSICTGNDFMGHKVFTTGKVLYVCGEGKGSISRRIRAAQITEGDFNNNLMILESRISIDNIAHMVQLQALIEKEHPVFVIFDTFSSLASSTDENSNTEVAHTLKMISDACSNGLTSSMIIHHTGKNAANGSRGASAFKNNTDFEFSMTRVVDCHETTLHCKKMKDGDEFDDINASAHVVELGIERQDGTMATSLILKPSQHDFTQQPKQSESLNARQYDILTTLHDAMDLYAMSPETSLIAFLNESGLDIPVDVVHIDKWRDFAYKKINQNQDANKKAFARAIKKLLELGKIATHDNFYWII